VTIDTDVIRKNLLKYTSIAFSFLPEMDKPAILDAGCGTGVPTIYLAQISKGNIVGVDIDSEALKKLDTKIRETHLHSQVTTVNSPIERMPFEKRTFDIV
jgi:ubiquinone/menaquinone biosynthesis C-methylase UbiE